MIDEEYRTRLAQIIGGAKADNAALVLGLAVDPRAGGAVKRHLAAVTGEKILAEVFTEILKEVAQPPDQRIVAQHRVLLLRNVVDDGVDQPYDEHEPEDRTEAVGHHP